jgi:hypothetical protein
MRRFLSLTVSMILIGPGLLPPQTPTNSGTAPRKNSLVGVWVAVSAQAKFNNCVLIAQETDGTLIASSSGNRVKVTQLNTGFFTLEFHPDSPACCSHTFIGHLSKDRATFSGVWQSGPNQASLSETWRRVSQVSCH